jgi:amino acid transporter
LNYSLDELIDPIKTLPKAAFGGVLLTVLLFLASMLSHFAVIPIDAIDTSRTTITAQFFVIIAGQTFGGYIVPVIIALSSLSSASCMAFGASRVILSAGQEGFLPYSSIFAKVSSRETPLHALVLNMLLTLILILAPPSGEIYQFLLAVTEYPEWVFYGLTVTGLLYLRVTCPDLKRPFVSSRILGALFVLVSVALVIVPFVPPSSISSGTSDIPYFLAPLIGALLILACVPWWYIKVYSRRHDEILLRSSLDKNKFQMIHFHRSS